MPAGEIHMNDFGTSFQVTFLDQNSNIIDISSSVARQIMFERPDGTTFTQGMGFLNSGSDGVATYTIQSGDLNLPGIWRFQGYVSMPSGTWYSDITNFQVFENIYIGSLP